MNLIETLNNTEKDLSPGEYCMAFDLMADTRANVSPNTIKNIKNRFRKKAAHFLLFRLSPVVFLLFIGAVVYDQLF